MQEKGTAITNRFPLAYVQDSESRSSIPAPTNRLVY